MFLLSAIYKTRTHTKVYEKINTTSVIYNKEAIYIQYGTCSHFEPNCKTLDITVILISLSKTKPSKGHELDLFVVVENFRIFKVKQVCLYI